MHRSMPSCVWIPEMDSTIGYNLRVDGCARILHPPSSATLPRRSRPISGFSHVKPSQFIWPRLPAHFLVVVVAGERDFETDDGRQEFVLSIDEAPVSAVLDRLVNRVDVHAAERPPLRLDLCAEPLDHVVRRDVAWRHDKVDPA